MAIQSSAILITGKYQAALGSHTLEEPGEGEVLIRAALTAISPGTEMRCFDLTQPGTETVPFIPGYCLVGTVEKQGPGASLSVGTRILMGGTKKSSLPTVWGGHTEWAIISDKDAVIIPDGVTFEAAVVAPLAGISHHGTTLSLPQKGEKVAVIGLGPIGMFSAVIHQILGAETIGIDMLPLRRELAASMGIKTYGSIDETLVAVPEGFNIVVDCSGVPVVLKQAVRLVRDLPWDGKVYPATRLMLQGSYADEGAPIPYRDIFFKEARLLIPRDKMRSDTEAVLQMMKEGKLPAEKLLSTVQPPKNAQAVYTAIRDRTEPWMTAAFRWS